MSSHPARPKKETASPAPRVATRSRPPLAGAVAAIALATVALSGCQRAAEPLRVSHDALGTVVSVTAYGGAGTRLSVPIADAFKAIAASEQVLSAYPDAAADPNTSATRPSLDVTSVAAFNRDPFEWHVLPPEAATILASVKVLGVEDYFSAGMLRVIGLYDFGGGGAVPDKTELARLVSAAHAFETRVASGGLEARFADTGVLVAPPNPPTSSFAPPAVGLDLSGAAKGAALDDGLRALYRTAEGENFTGALISAGSTTLVAGKKSGTARNDPWRVGIEDPRDPDKVIAIVEYSFIRSTGPRGIGFTLGTVSTSGDYQQAFVRNGVRYHHILDPVTGEPVRGIRSLTVVGAASGLDSDILSTALFVMGVERAEAYARAHDLGLFIVDEEGRTRIVPGPAGASFKISLAAE